MQSVSLSPHLSLAVAIFYAIIRPGPTAIGTPGSYPFVTWPTIKALPYSLLAPLATTTLNHWTLLPLHLAVANILPE